MKKLNVFRVKIPASKEANVIKIQGVAAHRVTIRLTWSRPPSFTVFCVTELLPGFIVSKMLFKIYY